MSRIIRLAAVLIALTACSTATAASPNWQPAGVNDLQSVAAPAPHGPTGDWKLIWWDEFTGTTIDGSKWTRPVWHVQNVDTDPANAWLYNGNLVLNLSSATRGALVRSTFQFKPGMVAEARVRFMGGTDPIWNWPGWWAAGIRYPQSGEHDIAEGLAKGLKVSYWNGEKRLRFGVYPSGDWGSAYHTFTLWRRSASACVYWDGRLIRNASSPSGCSYYTSDDGGPEALLFSLGRTTGEIPVLGKPSRLRVDWIRVWQRAS